MQKPQKDDSHALIIYLIFTGGLQLVSNRFKGNIKLDSNVIVGSASLTDINVSQQCLEACFNLYIIIVY